MGYSKSTIGKGSTTTTTTMRTTITTTTKEATTWKQIGRGTFSGAQVAMDQRMTSLYYFGCI